MVVAQASDQGVALEGSIPADRVLGSVDGTELIPAGSLQAASGGGFTPGYQLISPDLGIPSFFSNLQVLCCIVDKLQLFWRSNKLLAAGFAA